ncbi:protein-disulfide reductase DsbD [soil metagenome]
MSLKFRSLMFRTLVGSALAIGALSIPNFSFATAKEEPVNDAPLTAKARIELSNAESKEGTILIDIHLVEPYKAYADRFKLEIVDPPGAKIEQFKLSPLVQFMDTFSKKMKDGIKHDGVMTAKIKLATPDAKAVKLKLTYQACTTEHCLFPKNIALDPTVVLLSNSTKNTADNSADKNADGDRKPAQADSTALTPATASTNSPSGGGGSSEFEKAMGGGLMSAILFMIIAGFLTSLTPCIYPMIPITLAILGARERRTGVRGKDTPSHSRMRGFVISVFYVLGIATTYSILGVTAASTGALFGSALSNVYVVSTLALLFVGMGLSMYGLFEIQAPAFIRDRMGQGKTEAGFFGAYATGLAAGIVASPCIGPVLVSVLAYIAQTQNKMLGFILLFSFAMGMGVLFIVLGTSAQLLDKVPKAGSWMDGVKFVFGTTMVGMAIYYVAPVYPDWAVRALIGLALILIASAYGVFAPATSGTAQVKKGAAVAAFCIGIALMMVSTLQKSGFQLAAPNGAVAGNAAPAAAHLAWQKYSDEALAKAIADKKPVLIDFWADWCGACHELEERTFPDARIQELSKQFVLFKIDATNDSPELAVLKKTYNVMGLPTMVFYDSNGQMRSDITVTGFLEAPEFIERMNKAVDPVPRSAASEK